MHTAYEIFQQSGEYNTEESRRCAEKDEGNLGRVGVCAQGFDDLGEVRLDGQFLSAGFRHVFSIFLFNLAFG